MRDTASCRWQRWRVTLAEGPVVTPAREPAAGRFGRSQLGPVTVEEPASDGIRHELVARIRREIEAGTYDTEDRWAATEELLLRRVEGLA